MIILWFIPLIVMVASGMVLLILRGRPVCVRSNMHQLSVLALSISSVLALARWKAPDTEVILMAYAAAFIVVLSATREVARRSEA